MGLKFGAILGGAAKQINKMNDEERKSDLEEKKMKRLEELRTKNAMKLYTFKDNVDAIRVAKTLEEERAYGKNQLNEYFKDTAEIPIAKDPTKAVGGSITEGVPISKAPGMKGIVKTTPTVSPAFDTNDKRSNSFSFTETPWNPSKYRDQVEMSNTKNGVLDYEGFVADMETLKLKHTATTKQQREKVSLFNRIDGWGIPVSAEHYDSFLSEGEDGKLQINDRGIKYRDEHDTVLEMYGPKDAARLWKGSLLSTKEAADSESIIPGTWKTPSGTLHEVTTAERSTAGTTVASALNLRYNTDGGIFVMGGERNEVQSAGVTGLAIAITDRAAAQAGVTASPEDSSFIAQQMLNNAPTVVAQLKKNNITAPLQELNGKGEPVRSATGQELYDLVSTSLTSTTNDRTAVSHQSLVRSVAATIGNEDDRADFISSSTDQLMDRVSALPAEAQPAFIQHFDRATIREMKERVKAHNQERAAVAQAAEDKENFRFYDEEGATAPKGEDLGLDKETPEEAVPAESKLNKGRNPLEKALYQTSDQVTTDIADIEEASNPDYKGTRGGTSHIREWHNRREIRTKVQFIRDLGESNPEDLADLPEDLKVMYDDISQIGHREDWTEEEKFDMSKLVSHSERSHRISYAEAPLNELLDFVIDSEGSAGGTLYDDEGEPAVGPGLRVNEPHVKAAIISQVGEEAYEKIAAGKAALSTEDGREIAKEVIQDTLPDLKKLFPKFATFDPRLKFVLIDQVYNAGINRFKKYSPKFIDAVNDGNIEQAAREMAFSDSEDESTLSDGLKSGNKRSEDRLSILYSIFQSGK